MSEIASLQNRVDYLEKENAQLKHKVETLRGVCQTEASDRNKLLLKVDELQEKIEQFKARYCRMSEECMELQRKLAREAVENRY